MNMSEFNNQNNDEQGEAFSLRTRHVSLPDDFSEDDLEFAQELNMLFSLEDEELPPYFAQTLMAAEDPRSLPAEEGFAQKTSARVFRSLRLRRRLFPTQRSLISAIGETFRDVLSRKAALAWVASFVLLMMFTVAFTAPSFERGMVILLQGAPSGILRVHHYPGHVTRPAYLGDEDAPASPQVSLFALQQQLHFKMSWPDTLPTNFALTAINSYDDPGNTWADGPVLELIYSYVGPGMPKGTGEIVIREFLPRQDVLQVVQDGAAHPIGVDQNGNAKAIYVEGEWLPRGKYTPAIWSNVGRRELIFQQNSVVIWIAGDERDGIDQNVLWSMAQSMHPVTFLRSAMMRDDTATLLQADNTSGGPFVNDVLAIFSNDGVDGPYYINESSYTSGMNASSGKAVPHGHH